MLGRGGGRGGGGVVMVEEGLYVEGLGFMLPKIIDGLNKTSVLHNFKSDNIFKVSV